MRLSETIPGPDIEDYKFREQVIDAIGDIIHTIDKVVESLDLSGHFLPLVRHLPLMQTLVLQVRYALLNGIDDFRHAVHILEILPQLCHPTDIVFLRDVSDCLGDFLMLATRRFLQNRHPSKARLYQLLADSGHGLDFMTQAELILDLADNLSSIPSEVCACSPQSPIVQDVDWIITTVDDVIAHCNPSDQDLKPIASLLFTQVKALQARFRLLGRTSDLHRSMFVAEVASQFYDSTSHSFSVPSHPPLSGLYRDPIDNHDLDEKIAIGEELLTHSHEARELVTLKLVMLLNDRFTTVSSITDGERMLQLCQDALPFAVEEERLLWLELRADVLLRLSRLGRQFPDLSHRPMNSFDSPVIAKAVYRSPFDVSQAYLLSRYQWS